VQIIKRTVSRSRVRTLALDQLAGQRVIYAYSGLQPPASLLGVIHAGEAAGVIFFAPNIATSGQIRGVINEMQRASLASPVHTRLLVMVDQEGGEVRRLPGAPLLSERQVGASPNPAALATAAGTAAGRNLARAGMNLNLAPVLDVYRRPGSFIDQFQRSYSRDPAEVASLGAQFITAQQSTSVAATAKHFPGLGAATQSQDTDSGPVVLNQPLPILRALDEAPYRTAIAAGVKLVMTSWAIYPALDPHLPAGLSPAVIQGELRHRLGFRGVTISDGIDAGAVTPFGDLAKRSVRAARAGVDLILSAATNPSDNTPAEGIAVMHAIAAAIADHQLSAAAAEQAASRVLALRARP
jgi:beta-N-acetylhexosaminidase